MFRGVSGFTVAVMATLRAFCLSFDMLGGGFLAVLLMHRSGFALTTTDTTRVRLSSIESRPPSQRAQAGLFTAIAVSGAWASGKRVAFSSRVARPAAAPG
jgi:hypothetical protein